MKPLIPCQGSPVPGVAKEGIFHPEVKSSASGPVSMEQGFESSLTPGQDSSYPRWALYLFMSLGGHALEDE